MKDLLADLRRVQIQSIKRTGFQMDEAYVAPLLEQAHAEEAEATARQAFFF